jgi:hypothetical protein
MGWARKHTKCLPLEKLRDRAKPYTLYCWWLHSTGARPTYKGECWTNSTISFFLSFYLHENTRTIHMLVCKNPPLNPLPSFEMTLTYCRDNSWIESLGSFIYNNSLYLLKFLVHCFRLPRRTPSSTLSVCRSASWPLIGAHRLLK